MLNRINFINIIPVDDAECTIYHGSSLRRIQEAIAGDKWYFGCAANYEAGGEGLQFPGEREALDDLFQLDPLESATDAFSSQQLGGALARSYKDLYNSCWSVSQEVAIEFANHYDDGVVVSVFKSALAASFECIAKKWKEKSHEAASKFLTTLSSGDPDGLPETGWGVIKASAAFVDYLPKDYQHISNKDDIRSSMFMNSTLRNMRLPESYNGIDLEWEKEIRFSLDLSNSDGCRMRNPAGVGNVLAPMITQANTIKEYDGIWLNGLSINKVEGYTRIPINSF